MLDVGAAGAEAVVSDRPAHAASSTPTTTANGSARMIDARFVRNGPVSSKASYAYALHAIRVPSSRRPFDPYSSAGPRSYADREGGESGERRNVIVVVGILTVLVLAWLLFRAEARRSR
jgi:hypothetical protein